MALNKPALIFDLDGTLTDSKPGILGCLQQVIDARGMGDCGPLDRFIGPPVEEWVVELLPNGTSEEQRAHWPATIVPATTARAGGTTRSIRACGRCSSNCSAQGFPLYVCTSKQEHFAVRILETFGLAELFVAIYGDKAEYASHSKVDLLARILQRAWPRPRDRLDGRRPELRH